MVNLLFKLVFLTLSILLLTISSGNSAEQGISDEQLVVDIVTLEGIVERVKQMTELAGGVLPETTRQDLEGKYQQVVRGLHQLNSVASQRFTPVELNLAKQQIRVRQLEKTISGNEKLLNIMSDGNARKKLARSQDKAKNDLKLLKHKIAEGERQASGVSADASDPAKNNALALSDSRLTGVAHKLGKMEMKFDFISGFMIPEFKGGGVYLLLNDGTALKYSGAPSAINYDQFIAENPDKVKQLKDLDIPKNKIYPLLERGYTLDIHAENKTPGTGGPTFRSIVLTKEGRFQKRESSMIVSPEVDIGVYGRSHSLAKSTGTYFIDGNTVELQYDNGDVERTLFATNGTDRVILGESEYKVSSEN